MNTKVETTYRDDYNSPQVKYFPIPRITFETPEGRNLENCECDPVVQNSKTSDVSYEWSRLGPMGFLLEPKLYAVNAEPGLFCCGDFMKCGDTKNWIRNLEENLVLNEPTLVSYDLLRRIQEDRLKSTYQVDYDHLVEYPVLNYDEEILLKAEKPEIKCRQPVKPPWIGGHDIPGRPKRSSGFDQPVKTSGTERAKSRSRAVSVKDERARISGKDAQKEQSDYRGPSKDIVPERKFGVESTDKGGEIKLLKTEGERAEERTLGAVRGETKEQEAKAEALREVTGDVKAEIRKDVGQVRAEARAEVKAGPRTEIAGETERKIVDDGGKNKKVMKITAEVRVNIHKKPTEPRVSEYADVYCFTADEILKNKLHCTTKKCKKEK